MPSKASVLKSLHVTEHVLNYLLEDLETNGNTPLLIDSVGRTRAHLTFVRTYIQHLQGCVKHIIPDGE